jgi:tRNA A-37 threonylcarbamoyl transferase component Bud32
VGEADQGDLAQRVARAGFGAGYRVRGGPVWLRVSPEQADLPEHGWKLHVSARAATYLLLVKTLLPVLLRERCAFKLARSPRVLSELNDGLAYPASVGKAVTIYPDQQRIRALGLELAEILSGQAGPRILSDRQVKAGAPVYYRYGPFTGRWESDPRGMMSLPLRGPDGETFNGVATLCYQQPPWAEDPFTGQAGQDEPGATGADLLGGRYRVTAGIYQSARGHVCRATDQLDGSTVIIKQARALVAEDAGHNDTRARLRNERRVLQAVDGTAGVPRFLDHFRHADDEFLVTSDCGAITLGDDVGRNGPYDAEAAAGATRSLATLARQLARIVSDLHDRGVIIRDLSPKNIVLSGEDASIIDFGIAAYRGLHLPGGTAGYAPPGQQRGEQPREADDYYALGMTLLFVASGLHPVIAGQDPEIPRVRALQTIRSGYGPAPAGVIGAIADLLSSTSEQARTSFRWLARGQDARRPGRPAALPAIPALTQELAAEVTSGLLSDLLAHAGDIVQAPPDVPDMSIYSGSAGIGLELLHHAGDHQALGRAGDLLAYTLHTSQRIKLPPGLFLGRTGVQVFAQAAARHGIETAGPDPAGDAADPQWRPEDDDLISGTAGVGLGHLWLYRASGERAYLDTARQCLDVLLPVAARDSSAGAGLPPGLAATLPDGRAHGLAGLTGFVLAMAEECPDKRVLTAAACSAHDLANRTRALIGQTQHPDTVPMSASWCQGLAGIGPVLLHASTVLNDASYTSLARQAADYCICHLPRMSTLGRCCGAAGVGSFLIDLATQEQDQHYWDAARDVAAHLLLRSAGPPGRLVIGQPAAPVGIESWAFGLAGLLGFFRRLTRPGEPDSLPLNPAGITQLRPHKDEPAQLVGPARPSLR